MQSRLMLGLFLFSSSICYTFNLKGMTFPGFQFIRTLSWGFSFLLGPALYFYVRSIVNPSFILKTKHLLHGICFVLVTAVFPFTFDVLGEGTWVVSLGLIKYIHLAVYSVFAIRMLKRHRETVKNVFSTLQKKELSWLNHLIAGFLVVYGLFFLHYLNHVDTAFP